MRRQNRRSLVVDAQRLGRLTLGRGDPDDERRSLALPLALGADRSAVKLDELADEGEPDAETAVRPGRPAVGLPEALEGMRQEVGADPLAVVPDDERDVLAAPLDPHVDAAAGRGELDRVRQEVRSHLAQPVGIAVHRPEARSERGGESHPLAVGGGPDGIDRGLDGDCRSRDRAQPQTPAEQTWPPAHSVPHAPQL